MRGMRDLAMLLLRMIECPSIHVIPVPTRPGAHGCTAAWGFGFQLSPEVVQWMGGGATIRDLAEVKKNKEKGRDAGFVHMVWVCFLQGW